MNIVIDLPSDLVQALELRAAAQGCTVSELAVELLRWALEQTTAVPTQKPSAKSRVIKGENGIPTIQCGPNAPAEHMTIEELLALEQAALEEEDLIRAGLSR